MRLPLMSLALGILLLSAVPVVAQEAEDEPESLTRGIEQMLRDLFSNVEPALRELRETIGNLDDYEAPEMLPNGDIIIRRKTPLDPAPEPEEPEDEPPAEGPIEL